MDSLRLSVYKFLFKLHRLRQSYESEITDLEGRLENETNEFFTQHVEIDDVIPTRDIEASTLPNSTNGKNTKQHNTKMRASLNRSSSSEIILPTFAKTNKNKKQQQQKQMLNRSLGECPSPRQQQHMRSRDREDRDCASECSLSLSELRELFYTGADDFMREQFVTSDSSLDDEKDCLQKNMKEQYENKLKQETDLLMKRLLELSDELDRIRVNS